MSTNRVEAFSDGVFAIAITLLVLQIHVPPPGSGEHLARALAAQWPSYAAYAISFLTIGIGSWSKRSWDRHGPSAAARPARGMRAGRGRGACGYFFLRYFFGYFRDHPPATSPRSRLRRL